MGFPSSLAALLLLALSCSAAPIQGGCRKPADVVAVVDGSDSITTAHFEVIKATLLELVDGLGVTPGGAHLSIIVYSDTIREMAELSGNSSSLKSWITSLRRPEGGSNTHLGFQAMMEEFHTRGRAGVPQMGILISDGRSDYPEETKTEAAKARDAGVILFAAGIGTNIDMLHLEIIVQDPHRRVIVEHFEELLAKVNGLITEVCRATDPQCTGLLDMVAVVDGSGSITESQFQQMRQALIKIVERLDLSPEGIRLAVVLFGNSVSTVSDLSGDAGEVKAKIQAMKQPKGGTNTHLGLERMIAIVKDQGRTGLAKTAIVLTDGRSSVPTRTKTAAQAAHAESISVFAVGIGSKINEEELRTIASSPQQAVLVVDFDQLLQDVEDLVEQVCPVNPCNKALEVVAVVDGSGSISTKDFDLMKEALAQLVDTLQVTQDQIHLGLVLFSNRVQDVIALSGDAGAIKGKISAWKRPGSTTNTHLALDEMAKLFKEQGRQGIPTVGVVFTDGASTNRKATEEAAKRARDAGANLVGVGVGPKVNYAELRAIASQEDWVLKVDDYEDLSAILNTLVKLFCEIEGLCDGCRIINGAGFNAHPADCTKFIQCSFGVDGEVISHVQSCPPRLFWDQDKLTCNYIDQVDCPHDACRHKEGTIRYSFPGHCREFWDCLGGVAVPHCCPPGTEALGNGTCIPSDACEETCRHGNEEGAQDGGETEVDPEGSCNLRVVPGKPQAYLEDIPGLGWTERPCPAGTTFDPVECACVIGGQLPPVQPPSSEEGPTESTGSKCRRELFLPFNNGVQDESGRWNWVQDDGVKVENSTAFFDGSKSLRVPRFTNFEFGSDFVVRFRYLADDAAQTDQALVSNGDCGESPTFFVSRAPDSSLQFGFVDDQGQTTVNVNPPPRNVWRGVEFKVSGGVLTGRVGRNSTNSASASGSGIIRRNHCALQIGGGFGFDHFRGYIDNVRVFLCVP